MKETKYLLPFEDHRYPKKGKERLVMVQVKKATEYDGEMLEPTSREHGEWYDGKGHDGDNTYVSVVSYPETGEVICAVKSKVYGAVSDTYHEATKKALPPYGNVLFGFDGHLEYKNDIVVIDNMLIIRNYNFTNHKRNFGAGWYEVSRFIFEGNKIGYETRNGFDANFNVKSYFHLVSVAIEEKRKKAEGTRDAKKRARLINENKSKLDCAFFDHKPSEVIDEIVKVYPEFKYATYGHKSCFCLRHMLQLWTNIHHGESVYKRVPDRIREDLEKERISTYSYSGSSIYNRDTDPFYLYQEDGLTCYYSERKTKAADNINEMITGERIYITEDEMFFFRWNPILKKYVSSKLGKLCGQPFADKWGHERYFEIPKEKNGTRVDRLIGIKNRNRYHIDEVSGIKFVMSLASPGVEKIVKEALSLYLDIGGKSPLINGKFKDIENKIYQYWNLDEKVEKQIRNAKSTADIFQTNKKGVAVLKYSNLKQTIAYLFEHLNSNELSTIKDSELKMLMAIGMAHYEKLSNEFTEPELVYLERMAKSCRKKSENDSRATVNNFEEMLGLMTDYTRFREEFELIKPRLIAAGVNVAEYVFPEHPKPSHLHHFHDAVYREVLRYRDLVNAEKAAETSRKITEFSETEEYTRFLDAEDKRHFTILPATSGEDLVKEGAFLHHCVGTYRERMARKESYIYFLRKSNDKETPFYTMEVVKRNGRYSLNQCYTFHDTTDKSESCRQFIQNWAKNHHIAINCTV